MTDARQTPDLVDEQLAQQLSLLDDDQASDFADSTVRALKSELDTLASELREPPPAGEYDDESALQRAAELVRKIGQDPSSTVVSPTVTENARSSVLETLGQYQLLAKLGEGGMGAVYKALHTKLEKIVALKVLPAERLQDAAAVQRFTREMKAVGQLEHPNIVRATDAGDIDGKHYLVMELVEGVDLSNLVRRVGPACRSRRPGGTSSAADNDTAQVPSGGRDLQSAMTVADACEMIRQAALGLEEAHEHGMVHRDIKPSNLMLARTRRGKTPPVVKILDLGLALLDESNSPEMRELTSTGQMMGTLDYMAPEQGMDSHIVDIRADIYALGATLYRLLAGEPPLPSSKYNTPVKMMMALATEQAPSIATKRDDLPADLVSLVDRMLAKQPEDRFSTPHDVANALAVHAADADLAALLETATAEDSMDVDPTAKTSTREHFTSASHETAPTIDRSPQVPAEKAPLESTLDFQQDAVELNRSQPGRISRGKTAMKPATHRRISASLFRSRGFFIGSATALTGFVLLSAIIVYIKTNHGTIIVEIDDPSISVTVQGEDIQITKNDSGEAYTIKPGEHSLHVKRGDLEFDTDKFTLRRSEKVVFSVWLAEGEVQVVRKDHEGTLIGSEQIPQENYALNFDGKSSLIEIAEVNVFADTEFTLECWTTPLSKQELSGDPTCVLEAPAKMFNNRGSWWALGGADNTDGYRSVYADTPFEVGRNGHLAFCSNGRSLKFFVDGRLVAAADVTTFPLKAKKWTVGSNDRGNQAYHGVIDEVRISSVARYEKDFTPAERFEPDEHTLALYHFDEGQGDIAYDSSPNKHHGKIIGAKWVKADDGTATRSAGSSDQRDDPNRRAAEWVLSVGGKLGIRVDSQVLEVKTQLPQPPFQLLWVDVSGRSMVSVDGLAHLARVENLTGLYLHNTDVTDAALAHLDEFRNLDQLTLFGTNVSEYGVKRLAEALPQCKIYSGYPSDKWPQSDSAMVHRRATVRRERRPSPNLNAISPLAFAPDGKMLAAGEYGNTSLFRMPNNQLEQSSATFGYLGGVAFSPDGSRVWTLDSNQDIALWDAATGQLLNRTKAHPQDGKGTRLFSVAADGRVFTMGNVDGTVKEWKIEDELISTDLLSGPKGESAAAVSHDGKTLALASEKGIELYDTVSGARTGSIDWQVNLTRPQRITWSTDDMTILTSHCPDGPTRLIRWNVKTGVRYSAEFVHPSYVDCIALSPDGHLMATGGRDGSLKVWQIGSGNQIADLAGHDSKVIGAAFSPGFHALATSTQYGAIYLWDIVVDPASATDAKSNDPQSE